MKCQREIELLEYLLENLEYDSVIVEEAVHYSGQEQKDIIEVDGVEERLADSFEIPLENSLERWNQHTDVLIEKEKSEQHTKMLPKEEEALRPYVFHFNNCFVSGGFVVDAGENLAHMSNQVKMEEEGKYVGIDEQHSDVFERNQVQGELEDNLFFESKFTDIEQRSFGNSQECKDEREAVRIQQLQREDNEQQFEDEWTEYNKKWQCMY